VSVRASRSLLSEQRTQRLDVAGRHRGRRHSGSQQQTTIFIVILQNILQNFIEFHHFAKLYLLNFKFISPPAKMETAGVEGRSTFANAYEPPSRRL
jgi:hypothetical protein